ncbi:hypothetical protein pah_c012o013 [Parachlamydia acanthamoebae str. Hall's coccus]|jgi:hypothetical protein|nr:hypothetical protein pah_c012o013 [Parachlamydia acanthamoebae str. Hall's coccus]
MSFVDLDSMEKAADSLSKIHPQDDKYETLIQERSWNVRGL